MSDHTDKAPGPLHGIRVLDFTALLQGPLATQVLADLGADVVKLEKQDGEWMRKYGIFMTRTHGETDAFLAFNRNKRSVEIDLRDAADRERILELVDRADVVVENFRPGVMDRAGLGYETLRKRNPQLIYAASSGYGQTGPYAKRPGQDYLVQALTGATWLNGRRGDPPFLNALISTRACTWWWRFSPRSSIATAPAKDSASMSICSRACSPCSSRSSRCISITAIRSSAPRKTSGTRASRRPAASTRRRTAT
jgi:hypothetical protein